VLRDYRNDIHPGTRLCDRLRRGCPQGQATGSGGLPYRLWRTGFRLLDSGLMPLLDHAQFVDMNREQQGQICRDYCQLINGLPNRFRGTEPGRKPSIDDVRKGKF